MSPNIAKDAVIPPAQGSTKQTIYGMLFFAIALQVSMNSNKRNARRLMLASIVYLPVLFLLILIERIIL